MITPSEDNRVNFPRINYDSKLGDPYNRPDSNANTSNVSEKRGESGGIKYHYSPNDNIKLFIILKRDDGSDYKKLILMVPVSMKIALLKRYIEKEVAELFPKDPIYICSKIEDDHGFILSNQTVISEILKHGDKLTAYQDGGPTEDSNFIGKPIYPKKPDDLSSRYKRPDRDDSNNLRDYTNNTTKMTDGPIRTYEDNNILGYSAKKRQDDFPEFVPRRDRGREVDKYNGATDDERLLPYIPAGKKPELPDQALMKDFHARRILNNRAPNANGNGMDASQLYGNSNDQNSTSVRSSDFFIKDTNKPLQMRISDDVNEVLSMLKNIQQSICQKLAGLSFEGVNKISELMLNVIPLGFSPRKVTIHNAAVVLFKAISSDKLEFLEDKERDTVLNLVITLLNYWIAELIMEDLVLLNMIIDLLEVLVRSRIIFSSSLYSLATFCQNFKSGFVIANLMKASELPNLIPIDKDRLLSIIGYLSKGDFKTQYIPIAPSTDVSPDRNMVRKNRTPIRSTKGADTSKSPTPVNKNNPLPDDHQQRFSQAYASQTGSQPQDIVQQTSTPVSRRATPLRSQDYTQRGIVDQRVSDQRGDVRSDRVNGDVRDRSQNDDRRIVRDRDASRDILQNDLASNPDRTKKPDQSNGAGSGTYRDFLTLLTPDNTKELHIYAIQNLGTLINDYIAKIMSNKEDYLRLICAIEIDLPYEYENTQAKIFTAIDSNLNPERALDGLQSNIIQRIIKSFTVQPPFLHTSLSNLLRSHIMQGKYNVDVSVLISIILSPYARLHEFAMKSLSILSDPGMMNERNNEAQFDNHIKLILELSVSKMKSFEFKNTAINTISNLSLKEKLRNLILQNKGIEIILVHFRNSDNLDGQRIAAKALANLANSNKDVRQKIIVEISDEIKKLQKNELDPMVKNSVQTIVNGK